MPTCARILQATLLLLAPGVFGAGVDGQPAYVRLQPSDAVAEAVRSSLAGTGLDLGIL